MKIVLNWGIKTSLFRFLKSIMILIYILSGKKVKSIFFYPNQPISYDIMYWITILNRYKVVKNIDNNPDIKMYWQDDTFHAPEKNSKKNDNWINLNCTDISKERISRILDQENINFEYEKKSNLSSEKNIKECL